ncbi:hypothetical protein [Actinospica robiniae]|uniref:hypothetical protein n=1 Tax=Actinospica robiniae TaxID=304901 RepID=UPI0003F5CAF1|nr:hypothetical protein [Actinospica robiniae]
MNPFKGAGVILLALAAVLALTRVKDVAHLILLASVTIVALCMTTLTISSLRRHHDRLAAFGRIVPAPDLSAPATRPQPQPHPTPAPVDVPGAVEMAVAGPVPAPGPALSQDDAALWRPYTS